MRLLSPSPDDLARAAEILRDGGLVAFPTETVYGLGALAEDPGAVRRIFEAKGRPADHPVIVHLPDANAMDEWATAIPQTARALAARFWPGSLTLILRRGSRASDLVTGGQDTVGLRVPKHPVALGLLQAVGSGLAAPSANRFGRLSPTTAAHVIEELGGAVDAVIDGGPCEVGLESTILDLSGPHPRVLRPGAVTREALAEILGAEPELGGADTPRVPGALSTHYSPTTPLRLVDAPGLGGRIDEALERAKGSVAVLALAPPTREDPRCRWIGMPHDAGSYARVLYGRLRDADRPDCDVILVERPPRNWVAVNDRLDRAAKKG